MGVTSRPPARLSTMIRAGKGGTDHRRTSCKLCGTCVLHGEPAVWLMGRRMGLSHKECADREGLQGTPA